MRIYNEITLCQDTHFKNACWNVYAWDTNTATHTLRRSKQKLAPKNFSSTLSVALFRVRGYSSQGTLLKD